MADGPSSSVESATASSPITIEAHPDEQRTGHSGGQVDRTMTATPPQQQSPTASSPIAMVTEPDEDEDLSSGQGIGEPSRPSPSPSPSPRPRPSPGFRRPFQASGSEDGARKRVSPQDRMHSVRVDPLGSAATGSDSAVADNSSAAGTNGDASLHHGAASSTLQDRTLSLPQRSDTGYSSSGGLSDLGGASGASSSGLTTPSRQTTSSSTTGKGGPRSSSRSSTRDFGYRETLDAKSRNLEDGSRIINQYKLLKVVGQGAYGTVLKACLVEDEDEEYAVKEFGKTRLRKTHKAAKLRRPLRGRRSGGEKDNEVPPLEGSDESDPLHYIRREIAILKKLDHPNVVKLYEVLDDPTQDSLFMVFEYCANGTVIDIQLHRKVKPLSEAVARNYLAQIVLGVEYLHSNDIVHRDLKPDNILLTDSSKTCKIVDFGVSEMFSKPGDDTLRSSAGSPAFMSPELCTAGHGDFHGKADDVWSLGVTFYCMVVGRLPFDKHQFLELYESIKNDE